MGETKLDIQDKNFDLYVASVLPELVGRGQDILPRDIIWKLFKSSSVTTSKRLGNIDFLTKLFVLTTALKKRWWLVVEDENGILPEDFIRERKKKKGVSIKDAEEFKKSMMFVLGSKELMECFEFLNGVSVSPAYNFIIKGKNNIPSRKNNWKEEMTFLVNFLMTYEAKKKTWMQTRLILIPEWYVLMAMYHGKEMKGTDVYGSKGIFKHAYASSPTKVKEALVSLQQKGYIHKSGSFRRGAIFRITTLGIQFVNESIEKYVLACPR